MRTVLLDGRVKDGNGVVTHQRFICGLDTDVPHRFRVRLVAARAKPGQRKLLIARPVVEPPSCPLHVGGRVSRWGFYKAGVAQRQRYVCTPLGWYAGATTVEDPDHAQHVFTPDLPRVRVKGDDACPHCAELRAIHHGETAAGRKHSANTFRVAEALRQLAAGRSYAEVSHWLQGEVRGKDKKSAKRKDAWRRAADLVELFAPALWADWQRQIAVPPVARPDPQQPRVVMLDDLPLFTKAKGHARQSQRFAVLTCGEVVYPDPSSQTSPLQTNPLRLRLMRAFPTHNAKAYKLVLDELGVTPDFVLADGGKGIRPAVLDYARRKGLQVSFLTSRYHLRGQLGRALTKAKLAVPAFHAEALQRDLEAFKPFDSRAEFEGWWRRFEGTLTAQRVPKSAWSIKWKRDYYQQVCDELTAVALFPNLPRSTGALETLVSGQFKATIAARSRAFGNLARTNALLDLFVLHAAGYFDDMPHVMQVLRADAVHGDPDHPGFLPPVRRICDPGLYRSLLDPDVVERLAAARGLA